MDGLASLLLLLHIHAEVVSPTSLIRQTPVPNGGELVTIFQVPATGIEVPVAAYLKDTMGDSDPANDRIRDVWVLSLKRPSWPRQILSAVPFLYTRLPSRPPPPGRVPRPVVDLGEPQHGTVSGLAQQILQVMALDPLGTPYRAATRSFRLNQTQHRDLRIAEAVSSLAPMTEDPEIQKVRARLVLRTRLLGGLVSDRNLDLVQEKERIRAEEMRGRNWELLRQQAERNHFIFQPLAIGGGPQSHALLLISRNDLLKPGPKPEFHSRFLGISSPWNRFNRNKAALLPERIPLALYSLEHPKAPFLLADMRDPSAPKRREIVRRATHDATMGILGVSRFANVEYFAAAWVWDFISNRRGAANNRAWRIRSYAELRQKLNIDTKLDPALRNDLKDRVAKLSVNPLEDRIAIDNEIARVQHASLLEYAQNPKGLPLRLEHARQREAALFRRSHRKRVTIEIARWFSFGLYQGRIKTNEVMLAEIDRRRKIGTYARRLEEMLNAGPVTDSSVASLRRTAAELTKLAAGEAQIPSTVQILLSRFEAAMHDANRPAEGVGAVSTPAVNGGGSGVVTGSSGIENHILP